MYPYILTKPPVLHDDKVQQQTAVYFTAWTVERFALLVSVNDLVYLHIQFLFVLFVQDGSDFFFKKMTLTSVVRTGQDPFDVQCSPHYSNLTHSSE